MGEGGVVTTNDAATAAQLRRLRNHGLVREPSEWSNRALAYAADGQPNPWYYEMHEPGFNYRASDVHCALGLSQLSKLSRFVEHRQRLVGHYDRLLARFAPLVRPIARTAGCSPGWHLYVALIDFAAAGLSRGEMMRRLQRRGIGTQVHYIPVHLQPYYARQAATPELPGAQRFYERCLSLPLFAGMDETDVERVVDALAEELRAGRA